MRRVSHTAAAGSPEGVIKHPADLDGGQNESKVDARVRTLCQIEGRTDASAMFLLRQLDGPNASPLSDARGEATISALNSSGRHPNLHHCCAKAADMGPNRRMRVSEMLMVRGW